MLRTSNPTIKRMSTYVSGEQMFDEQKSASYLGVALRGGWFVALTILSAVLSAVLLFRFPVAVLTAVIVSFAVAFVSALVASFAPRTVKVSGSLYAIAEGVVVGSVSALVGVEFGSVVFASVMATFLTFATLLVLYAVGWIRVGNGFRRFVIGAMLAVLATQALFGIAALISPTVAFVLYGNGVWPVLFSVLMVCFAAACLIMDFAQITEMVESGMDKSYEWNAAFGLCVTLVWLYMEMLRLLLLIAVRMIKRKN